MMAPTSIDRGVARRGVAALAAAFVLAGTGGLMAQAPQREAKSAAGQPAAVWTPRLTPDGQPDITGRWTTDPSGTYDMTRVESGGASLQRLIDAAAGRPEKPRPNRVVDPADGVIPYLPWARAKQQEVQRYAEGPIARHHIDPRARCLPGGVPREAFPTAFRFIQVPGAVIFLGDQKFVARIIRLDDRPWLDDRIKLWMGDSHGRWEGNTLVVEVRNQNSKGRFDMVGNFASDQVRVVERWTLVGDGQMDYRATIEDPTVYSRPWTIASKVRRLRPSKEEYGEELWEDACHEGERSADHMVLTPEKAAEAAVKPPASPR